MVSEATYHVALLLLEATVVSGVLLAFFRLRKKFGLSLLCVTLGTFQHLQTQLAASLYVEVWPDIFVSPGSAVLFTATLFATLLIYIRDDAAGARSVIAGIVAANVTLTALLLVTQMHLTGVAATATGQADTLYFVQNIKPLLIGTALLCIDVVLIIILYEFFFRLFRRSLLLRVSAAMVVVVVIDTAAFVTLNFLGDPRLLQILVSGLIGKGVVALFYSVAMVIYLKKYPAVDQLDGDETERFHGVFHILTYRQRYEILKHELTRDSMTGLFNRGFFNKTFPQEVERAARLQHTMNLMLVDLDKFKSINDDYGHQAGDEVILMLAQSMKELFRAADIPVRYGGEEFAVILPDSSAKAAFTAAHRLRRKLREKSAAANLTVPVNKITFTAGIATYPDDAESPDALLRIADERLYAGKRDGRDRVVAATPAAAAAS